MKARCPICAQVTDSAAQPDFPFCSERHRLIDLGHWADESYRISEPLLPDANDAPPPPRHDEPERDS